MELVSLPNGTIKQQSLLSVKDLHVDFHTPEGLVRAVDGISFEVLPGKTLCLVGESGCGKTVTATAIMGLLPKSRCEVYAQDLSLECRNLLELGSEELRKIRGRDISMVFQEPMTSLNPVYTIGMQLREVFKTHTTLSSDEIDRECLAIMSKVGIPNPEEKLTAYPHQLSGGLRQRCMIAISLASKPKLLIADEPTTALDVTIQAQVLELLRHMRQELGMSILLITHDFGVVSEMADDVAVMYAGKLVEKGPLEELLQNPVHPYTRALLSSIPGYQTKRGTRLKVIKGAVPNPLRFPTGCRFHPRCAYAQEICKTHEPELSRANSREILCWRVSELSNSQFSMDSKNTVFQIHEKCLMDYSTESSTKLQQNLDERVILSSTEHGEHAAVIRSGNLAPKQKKPILSVQDLRTYFPIKAGVLSRVIGYTRAVDDVSFSIYQGETLGLVGESGCGKTTLGRTILKLVAPTSGSIFYGDDVTNITSLSEQGMRRYRLKMQIVFQDPYSSLNPRLTVQQMLMEILKQSQVVAPQDAHHAVAEILEKVGLSPLYAPRYPHEFSGGQRQRIAIARAIAFSPEFIVCDEPVSALDVSIQSQILNLLMDLKQQMGMTYLFISHALNVVEHISDRVAVMYLGRIVEMGQTEDIFESPLHPYTQALLSAVPPVTLGKNRERIILEGDVPSATAIPSGCRFRTRCWRANSECKENEPLLVDRRNGHYVACLKAP